MINGETQSIENAYNRFPGVNLYNKAWITAFQKSCQETSKGLSNEPLSQPWFLMISGSRGRGTAHPNSDIDTLTIVPTNQDKTSSKPEEVTSSILTGLTKHFVETVEGDLEFNSLKNWLGLLVDVEDRTKQKLAEIRVAHPDKSVELVPGMKMSAQSPELMKAKVDHTANDPALAYRAFKLGLEPKKPQSNPYPLSYDEEPHHDSIESILTAIKQGKMTQKSVEILWIIASEEGKNIFSHPPGTFNDFKQQIVREIIEYKKIHKDDFEKYWQIMEKRFKTMRDRSGLKMDDKYPKFYTDLLKYEKDQPPLLDFWRNEKLPNVEELLVESPLELSSK